MHLESKDPILLFLGGILADLRKDITLEKLPDEQLPLKIENDCLIYLKEELMRDGQGGLMRHILNQASEEDHCLESSCEPLFSDTRFRRVPGMSRRQCIRVLSRFYEELVEATKAEIL